MNTVTSIPTKSSLIMFQSLLLVTLTRERGYPHVRLLPAQALAESRTNRVCMIAMIGRNFSRSNTYYYCSLDFCMYE
ncbi:hypothetical protein BDV97DRAFT_354449 [Delphinella strobiligena]|nr:hypothetical protein BDV97DRAFT_354449 [Delphinella strobiligena]